MSSLYYLCTIKNNRLTGQIYGFDCIKYDRFEDADGRVIINSNENQTAIIPISKYTPVIIHPHILNYKLFNLFWSNVINIRD
jgi:hypothetical protein